MLALEWKCQIEALILLLKKSGMSEQFKPLAHTPKVFWSKLCVLFDMATIETIL